MKPKRYHARRVCETTRWGDSRRGISEEGVPLRGNFSIEPGPRRGNGEVGFRSESTTGESIRTTMC